MADEKKENGFSKFFKKIGKSISDCTREDKLSRAFRNKAHVQDFTIYTDDSSLLSLKEYFGILDDGKKEVTLYGDINDNDVPYSSILSTKTESDNELPRRFYLLERRVENIDIELEEKDENDNVVKNTYSSPVTIFTVDGDLKEVKVIKVKNTYYLKQEQK